MIEVEIDKNVYLPCYHHLLNDDEKIDIEFIWGGRDSGKSKFVAQRLIEKSMYADYFRCLLIKETHESIKDAQWQTLKDVAEDWGLDSLFTFGQSPLKVDCVNGNKFITRGMNNPGRIRSISNPSDAWVEEANQLSQDGFITLLTSLRSNHGHVKLWFSFNPESPEADFSDYWLYKLFFAKYHPLKNFTGEIVMKVGDEEIKLRYRSTHTTYKNNPYVTPQRRAFHESLKDTNYYWYKVFTLGEWGNKENDSPWAWAFKREKHVGKCVWNASHYTYLSFDFNRNPICCTVIQWYEETIFVIECIKLPNSNIYKICDQILLLYPNAVFMVTGDATGKGSTALVQDEINYYSVIKQKLNLNWNQIKVPSVNPSLEDNQLLVNSLLLYYKWVIDEDDAKLFIFDMENVRMLPSGKIDKEDRKDPKKQADALDTGRYFCNTFLSWFLKTIQSIKKS